MEHIQPFFHSPLLANLMLATFEMHIIIIKINQKTFAMFIHSLLSFP